MRLTRRHVLIFATVLIGFATSAQAQTGSERIRISVNGAEQATSRTLTQNFTLTKNVEKGPITTAIDVPTAPIFDIGGSYKIMGRLAVGVAVSRLSNTDEGAIDAKIPHPFYFNAPRSVTGIVNLDEKQTGVHVSALYFLPLTGNLEIGVFGGPSFFSVEQGFVTDVAFSSAYPFDAATFTSASTTNVSTSVTGFNVGADVAWRLSRAFAVGGLFRFTGGSTTFAVDSGNEVEADVGGLHVGGGIRVYF